MQRRQQRDSGFRQVGVEIEAVHVHQVDRNLAQRFLDGDLVDALSPAPRRIVQCAFPFRSGNQSPDDPRTLHRDDNRVVARFRKLSIQQGQNLFGPAHSVRPYRCKRISDTQYI